MSQALKLTPRESITIRRSTPELLEVEAVYGAGGNPPPKHFHPRQSERFEVLEGELRARIGSEERTLSPGDVLDVPEGAVHQMWNPGREPARVLWRTFPGGRTEQWFWSVDALHRSDRVRADGSPSPLAFGVLLREFRDVFRLAGPQPVLRPALALLAVAGRARGYRAAAT